MLIRKSVSCPKGHEDRGTKPKDRGYFELQAHWKKRRRERDGASGLEEKMLFGLEVDPLRVESIQSRSPFSNTYRTSS